jgi:SAM-dependent methyltransferase
MRALISFVTRFIPRHLLQRVAHIALQLISPFYWGSRFEDPINGKKYRKLLSYGRADRSRPNALAPNSLSLERHRAVWMYLKDHSDMFNGGEGRRMLHLAPEYCFLKRFNAAQGLAITRADLVSPWADVHFDVHEIPFGEDHFDIIMGNHLMEHVADDRKVMSEYFRVMKPGGWGIFQVPLDRKNAKTLEDPEVTDPAERERLYWQRGHVRLYGMDYADRYRSVGFEVEEFDLRELFGKERFERCALGEERYLHVVRKPA